MTKYINDLPSPALWRSYICMMPEMKKMFGMKTTEEKTEKGAVGDVQISLLISKKDRDFCRINQIGYRHIFQLGIAAFTGNPQLLSRISSLETENKQRFAEYYALRKLFMEAQAQIDKMTAERGK